MFEAHISYVFPYSNAKFSQFHLKKRLPFFLKKLFYYTFGRKTHDGMDFQFHFHCHEAE